MRGKNQKRCVTLIMTIIMVSLPFSSLLASTSRTFTYSFNDVSFDTLDGYDVVSMDEACQIDSAGKPDLPYFTCRFLIPDGSDVSSVTITSSQHQDSAGSFNIYPFQPDYAPGEEPDFVEPDTVTYNSSDPYPGVLAECIGMGFFDGANKIATIAIYPLQYQPADEELTLYTSISFSLSFTTSSDEPTTADIRTSWGLEYYEEALKSLIINDEDMGVYDSAPTLANEIQVCPNIAVYPYTIITSAAKASYYDDFVEWQRMKGIYTGVVTVENICNVFPDGDEMSNIEDDAGSIRQYLQYGWENLGLVFALLAGDDDTVPVRYNGYGYDCMTDFYFSEFNSVWSLHSSGLPYYTCHGNIDYYPEISVGRITASTQQQVDWWFNKVKKYETCPGNGDHFFDMCWSQSDQMQGQQQIQGGSGGYLTDATWWPGFLDVEIFEEVPNWYCPSTNPYDPRTVTDPQGADVINEMNTSPYYGWLNVYGHGNFMDIVIASNGVNSAPGGWGLFTFDSYSHSPWFQNETGNGLDNITNIDDKYPIFYTIACRSFEFDDEDYYTPTEGFTCFSETGGPAALGNTCVGLISSSYKLHSRFLEQLWSETNYVIGFANGLSKSMFQSYTLAMNMTLVGSPEMNVWITQPLEFTIISHPLSIPEAGNSSFTVNTGITTAGVNGERVLVCIYQEDGGFWEFGEVDSNGDITFDIDLSSTDRLWVTANRYDYIPYQYSMVPGVPAPPQGVTLDADANDHPLIEWDANTEDDFECYHVYKRVTLGSTTTEWRKQNTQPITTESWVDTTFEINPQSSAKAEYFVKAEDDDENESESSEIVSTVGHQSQSSESADFITILLQDYDGLMAAPNPFNETVRINFALPKAGKANISIYDINGRKVAELFDGITEAKQAKQLNFNASRLASGVYFCKLTADSKVSVRKLVYLK